MQQNILVKIGGDISGLSQSLSRAGSQVQSFGQNVQQMGESISATGRNIAVPFAAVSAGLATAVGLSVKAASDYESAFAGVRKTVDATEAEFKMLSDGIIAMSKVLPASANEIATVAEAAGQLGIEVPNILGFTRTMVDLGESTNMSADEAAMALARLANITQMPQDQFDRLGSTVVGLGNNLATTESEIVNMGLRIAGAGTQVGMAEADILSFAGALSSVGIEAEAGGTAFSRVLLTMNTAVANGGKELKAFADIAGVSSSEFAKAFKDDASAATISFIEGLARLSGEGENTAAILADLGLGEIRVRDALMRAAGASNVFSDALELGRASWQENIALTEEAEERYKTFESQLAIFGNKLTDIARLVGGLFMEAFAGLLSAISPAIDKIGELVKAFVESDSSLKDVVVGITLAVIATTGLIAGFGALLMFVGSAVSGFGALASIVSGVAGMLGLTSSAFALLIVKVVAVIAVISAIVAAVIYAYNEFEWFRNGVNEVWTAITESITTAAAEIWDIITQIFGQIMEIIGPVIEHIKEDFTSASAVITEVFGGAFTFISELIASVIEFISEVIITGLTAVQEFLAEHGETITELLIGAYEFIKSAVGAAIDFIWDIVTTVLTAVQDFWAAHGDTIISFATNAWETIKGIVDTVINTVSRIVENVLGHIQDFWSKHGDTVMGIVEWLFDFIKSDISSAIDFISDVISNGLAFIEWLFETFWPIISGIVEVAWGLMELFVQSGIDIIAGILDVAMSLIEGDWEGAWEAIKGIAQDIWDNIIAFFENIDLYQIGADIIQGLINGIGSMFGAVKKKVGELAGLIPDGVKSFLGIKSPSRLMRDEVGTEVVNGVIAGINDNVKHLVAATNSMGGSVVDAAKSAFAIASPIRKKSVKTKHKAKEVGLLLKKMQDKRLIKVGVDLA